MSAAILDYLFEFSPHALFMDPAIGVIATVLCGWLNLAEVSKISQQNLPAPVSLCYNADTMQYEFRFANDNNNNDNDDPKIVGRSFAG